jgi:hypothetical protein
MIGLLHISQEINIIIQNALNDNYFKFKFIMRQYKKKWLRNVKEIVKCLFQNWLIFVSKAILTSNNVEHFLT